MNAQMRAAALRLVRAEVTPDDGCVYFVQNTGDQLIKIGCTQHLDARVDALQREAPAPLRVIHVIADRGYDLESALHAWFADDCAGGEWFRPTDDLLGYIEERVRSVGRPPEGPIAPRAAVVTLSPDALRTLRVRNGLTLTALGVKAGLSTSLLSRMESGKTRGTPASWAVIAAVLDCEISDLLAAEAGAA